MFSSHNTPSLEAHWNPATHEFDLVEVLNSLGAVHHDVGSVGLGSEAPDLPGFGDVELVLVSQVATSDLEVVSWVHISLVNVLSQTIRHGHGSHEQSVVLVGRLRQTHLVRLL